MKGKDSSQGLPIAPWERREDESDAAWGAFLVYRGLGLNRTYAATAAACRKHVSLIQRWAIVKTWRSRTVAWDRDLDRVRIDAHREAVKEMETRHAGSAALLIRKVCDRLGEMTHEDMAQVQPRDLAGWFKLAVEVERRSRWADRILRPRMRSRHLDAEEDAQFLQDIDIDDLFQLTNE
jgi:hypothetical protein